MADDNGSSSGLENLSERAYEIARRRQAAALQVVAMLEEQYEGWFGSSAATVLHAGAWLAGTSLRRALEADGDAPGSEAFAAKSSEEGLKLMKVFMFLVDKDGIKLKPSDFAAEIPADQNARKSIAEVQAHLQKRYNDIMRLHEFDYLEGAKTGAVACARLMKLHCLNRNDLEPPVAATMVSTGFVEAVNTEPVPVDEASGRDAS